MSWSKRLLRSGFLGIVLVAGGALSACTMAPVYSNPEALQQKLAFTYAEPNSRYEQIVYMSEGDFVYVPPFVPHIEGNLSHTEELIWLTTRNPDNIVVNLENQDIADIDIAYVD